MNLRTFFQRILWDAAALLCASAVVLAQGQSTAPQQSPAEEPSPTFSARSDLVVLRVSVSDRRSGWLAGLNQSAFTIYQDGVPQQISFFSNEDVPVSVGLVVDSSGSMGAKRDLVRAAMLQFAQSSNPLDEMFVIGFNEDVRFGLPPSMPFTSDLKRIREALTITGARGMTALYDAIDSALIQLDRGTCESKALIVLSDGSDNASSLSFEKLMSRVQTNDAVIYTVGLFARDDPDANKDVLEKIARVSGGDVFIPDRVTEVSALLERIARDIRHSYTIGYVPTAAASGGESYHRVKVLVRAPNRQRLTVRHREGYSEERPARSSATAGKR